MYPIFCVDMLIDYDYKSHYNMYYCNSFTFLVETRNEKCKVQLKTPCYVKIMLRLPNDIRSHWMEVVLNVKTIKQPLQLSIFNLVL